MTQPTPEVKPWDETLRQAFVQPRHAAGQFAQCTRTPADAWVFLAQLHDAADDAVQHWPRRTEHACAPGCFFCCFLWIDAMPLEVLRIADYLQRTASPERSRRGAPTPARAAFRSPRRAPVWVAHGRGSLCRVCHTADDLSRVPFLLQVRVPGVL